MEKSKGDSKHSQHNNPLVQQDILESGAFISTDFPFQPAPRSTNMLSSNRTSLPSISNPHSSNPKGNSEKSSHNYLHASHQRFPSMRRTHSTFKSAAPAPSQQFIDSDTFFMSPEESIPWAKSQKKTGSTSKQANFFKYDWSRRTQSNAFNPQNGDSLLSASGSVAQQQQQQQQQSMMGTSNISIAKIAQTTSQKAFKEITVNLTDPVFRINTEKMKGAKSMQLLTQQQQQLQQPQQASLPHQHYRTHSLTFQNQLAAAAAAAAASQSQQYQKSFEVIQNASANANSKSSEQDLSSSYLFQQQQQQQQQQQLQQPPQQQLLSQNAYITFRGNRKFRESRDFQQESGNTSGAQRLPAITNSVVTDIFKDLPASVQNKHKISSLLTQIEENSRKLIDYRQQNNLDSEEEFLSGFMQSNKANISNDQALRKTGFPNYSSTKHSTKWLGQSRRPSMDNTYEMKDVNLSQLVVNINNNQMKRKPDNSNSNTMNLTNNNQGEDAAAAVVVGQISQRELEMPSQLIDRSPIRNQAEFAAEEEGGSTSPFVIRNQHVPSFHSATNVIDDRHLNSNPMLHQSNLFHKQRSQEEDLTAGATAVAANNNESTQIYHTPFLSDADMAGSVSNSAGGDLLVIKMPNLQNYKVQPLELFDSQLSSDPNPLDLIKDGTIRAFSRWIRVDDGQISWKGCEILSYNPATKRFHIRWVSNGKTKEVSRLNLMYEWENEDMMNERNKEALRKREQLLYYLGIKSHISGEGSSDKSIYFPRKSLEKITERVFNSASLKSAKKQLYTSVVKEVLEMFKYEVIKFSCEMDTVPSLELFLTAYYPELAAINSRHNQLYLSFSYLTIATNRPSSKLVPRVLLKQGIQSPNDNQSEQEQQRTQFALLQSQAYNETAILQSSTQNQLTGSAASVPIGTEHPTNPEDTQSASQVLNSSHLAALDLTAQSQIQQKLQLTQSQQQQQQHQRSPSIESQSNQQKMNIFQLEETIDSEQISELQLVQEQELVYEQIRKDNQIKVDIAAATAAAAAAQYNGSNPIDGLGQPHMDLFKFTQANNGYQQQQQQLSDNQAMSKASQATTYLQKYKVPKPYFEFLLASISPFFYFSREDSNCVFSRIVPSISKLMIDLRQILIYDFMTELKHMHTIPAVIALSEMNQSMIARVKQVQRQVDRLEELVFDLQTRNQRRHKADPKRRALWTEGFLENFTHLVVRVVQSHLTESIKRSMAVLKESMQSYYAIMPFDFMIPDEYVNPIYERAFLIQKKLLLEIDDDLENYDNSIEGGDIDINNQPRSFSHIADANHQDSQLLDEIDEKTEHDEFFPYESPIHTKNRRSTQQSSSSSMAAAARIRLSKTLSIQTNAKQSHEEEQQALMKKCWPCFQQAHIIYGLYRQLVDCFLSERLLHFNYQSIDKRIIKPLFRIKAKFLNDRNPNDKKQLESIQKRINFKRLQDLQRMEEIIDNGREKFWRFQELEVNMRDIFNEIAKRNFEEIDPTTFQSSIGNKSISTEKMGWFNMKCFTIVYDPPISEFELQFKKLLQHGIDSVCNTTIFYKKGSLVKFEEVKYEFRELQHETEEFLTCALYGLYSFFVLLQRFEFYFLFAHKYERYLQKRVDSNELDIVFGEIDKMDRDLQFLRQRMKDEITIGLFVVDTREYKDTLSLEIKNKISFAKRILKEKFLSSLEQCTQLGDKTLAKMASDPKNVREYIKLYLYMQGDELATDLQSIRSLISISDLIVQKQQLLLIEISSDDLLKIISAEMIHREVLELKAKKDAKQQKDRPKYTRMHLEEKEKVKKLIDETKIKMQEIREISSFDKVEQQSRDCENVISLLYSLKQQVQQLQEDGLNLDQEYDPSIDITSITDDFENYEKIWQYLNDWITKKQIWLFKPLMNTSSNATSMQISDIRDVAYMLERGNKIMHEVEPFFQAENQAYLPLIERIVREISDFQAVYELLVQVKDESFKTQHWHQIFDFVYDKNEEKKKRMKKMSDGNDLNLNTLILDGILEYIQSIKVIAVEAKDEFKSQQSVNYIEQEFSNLRFNLLNYFQIQLISDIRSIIDRLKHEEFKVGELLRNKIFQKSEYLEKLRRIEYFVKRTRKVLKIIAGIQDSIVRFAPIFRFKENEQKFKGIEVIFRKVVAEFKKHTEEITKRGMSYFLALFSLDSLDLTNQADIFDIFSQISQNSDRMHTQLHHIVHAVRLTHPRFAFLSDDYILELSQSVFLPEEFLGRIQQLFPGVKEFKCQPINEEQKGSSEQHWEIYSIVNHYDEIIELPSALPYILKYLERSPSMGMTIQLEEELKRLVKQQILFHLKPIAAKNFNYWKIWNLFLVKKFIIFQTFFLINDILFMHDLTLLLSLDSRHADLPRFLQHLTGHYEEFTAYYRQVSHSGLSRSHALQFTQALIQISQHMEIIKKLMSEDSPSLESFTYLMLPKFTLQMPIDDVGVDSNLLVANSRKAAVDLLDLKFKEEDDAAAALEALRRQPRNGGRGQSIQPIGQQQLSTQQSESSTAAAAVGQNGMNSNQLAGNNQQQNQYDVEALSASKLPALAFRSEYINYVRKRPQQLEINLMCFLHKVSYGFELMPTLNNIIFSESMQRLIHQAVSSLSGNFGCVIRGAASCGKKTAIKTVSTILGRSLFDCDISQQSPQIVQQILLNAASSNYYVNLANIETCTTPILSLVANILFSIRKAVAQNSNQFSFDGKHVEVGTYPGIFATISIHMPSSVTLRTDFPALPKTLLDSFRVLTYVKPDTLPIIHGYLEILGFEKEEQIETAKRLLFLVEYLSSVSSNQQYTYQRVLYASDFEEITNLWSEKHQRMLSLKSLMVILRNALHYQQEHKKALANIANSHQVSLRIAVNNYFSGILPYSEVKYMKNVFVKLFPWGTDIHETSEPLTRAHQENVVAFCNSNSFPFQRALAETSAKLLPLVMNSVPFIVYGPPESKKNLFISLLSFLTSVARNENFNVNFLNIDSMEPSTLFNSKAHNTNRLAQDSPYQEKKKGFLNMLVDTMRYSSKDNKELINAIQGKQGTFCTYLANTITEKLKTKKNAMAARSNSDWIVIDGSADCVNANPQAQIIDKLLHGFEVGEFTFEDGDILTVPTAVTTIFSLKQLHNISPGAFNKYMLFFFSNDMIKIQDEYAAWFRKLLQRNAFFAAFNTIAKSLFVFFIEPFFNLISSTPTSHLSFKRSIKSQLRNFLEYLEIFFNEIRKMEISLGEYEADGMTNIPSGLLRRERRAHMNALAGNLANPIELTDAAALESAGAAGTGNANNMNKKRGSSFLPNVGEVPFTMVPHAIVEDKNEDDLSSYSNRYTQRKSVLENKQSDRKSLILNSNSPRASNFSNVNSPKSANLNVNQLGEGMTPRNKSNSGENTPRRNVGQSETCKRLTAVIESLFVFALTWSLGNNFKPKYHYVFNDFLKKSIEKYTKFRTEFLRMNQGGGAFEGDYAFGHNLSEYLFSSKQTHNNYPTTAHSRTQSQCSSIFHITFDMIRSRWVEWRDFEIDESSEISGLIASNAISNREIVRLNPFAIGVVSTKNTIEKKDVYLPANMLFVETESSKLAKYFLSYFAAYAKPLLLLATSQSGTTSCVRSKLKNLQESHAFSCFQVSITPGTSISTFQRSLEKNLVWKNSNHLTSVHQTSCLVFIDDLNLASKGISPIGALRSLAQHNGWYSNSKMKYINFSSLSYVASVNSYDINSVPLTEQTVLFDKMASLKMQELSHTDLVSIFQTFHEDFTRTSVRPQERITIEAVKGFVACIALLNQTYKQQLNSISTIFNANLSMHKSIELVKNLKSFTQQPQQQQSSKQNANSANHVVNAIVFLINQYLSSEFIHQPYSNLSAFKPFKESLNELKALIQQKSSQMEGEDRKEQSKFAITEIENEDDEDSQDSENEIENMNQSASIAEVTDIIQESFQQFSSVNMMRTEKRISISPETKYRNSIKLSQNSIGSNSNHNNNNKQLSITNLTELPQLRDLFQSRPKLFKAYDYFSLAVTEELIQSERNRVPTQTNIAAAQDNEGQIIENANDSQSCSNDCGQDSQEVELESESATSNILLRITPQTQLPNHINIGGNNTSAGAGANSSAQNLTSSAGGRIAYITSNALSHKLIPIEETLDEPSMALLLRKTQAITSSRELQLEEKRVQAQERRSNSQHFQISRDVSNAYKSQAHIEISETNIPYHNNTDQLEQLEIHIPSNENPTGVKSEAAAATSTTTTTTTTPQKQSYLSAQIETAMAQLSSTHFDFESYQTLPDQFSSELVLILARYFHSTLSSNSATSTTQSQSKKHQSASSTLSTYNLEQILTKRQDLLYFDACLLAQERIKATSLRTIVSMHEILLPTATASQETSNQTTTTTAKQSSQLNGIRINERFHTVSDFAEMHDFIPIDFDSNTPSKQTASIISFLLRKLFAFVAKRQSFNPSTSEDIKRILNDPSNATLSILNSKLSKNPTKSNATNSKSSGQSPPIGTINPPTTDLVDTILLQESNAYCFFTHSVKLLHLFQLSSQHIFLKSTLSSHIAKSIIHFTCEVAQLNIFEFFLDPFHEQLHATTLNNSNSNTNPTVAATTTTSSNNENSSASDGSDNSNQSPSLFNRFNAILFAALQNLFLEESQIIIYIRLTPNPVSTAAPALESPANLSSSHQSDIRSNNSTTSTSSSSITSTKQSQAMPCSTENLLELFDLLHRITEGAEIASILSKNQLEFLITRWKLRVKFPRLNDYILNYFISYKIKQQLRFVLQQDVTPRADIHLEELQRSFAHLFSRFTKYNMYPLVNGNSGVARMIQVELCKEILGDAASSTIFLTDPLRQTVLQVYSKEQTMSKIYEDAWRRNLSRTFEESFGVVFLAKHVLEFSLKHKVEKARRKNGMLKLIGELEKKQISFVEEIEKAEAQFATTKEAKKSLIKVLTDAEAKYGQLKAQQDEYAEKEKQIVEMLARCQATEANFRVIQSQMLESAAKVSKVSKATWIDEIKPAHLIQLKQMTVYILIFFIGLHRIIPDKYNVSMQQLADDVVDGIQEINKNSMNINNIELYREKFSQIVSDCDEFKSVMNSFKEEYVKKNTYDLFKCLNKEGGSSDAASGSYVISLTGNLNIYQREILKYLDSLIEMYRLTLEVRSLNTTSLEQKEKLRSLKDERDRQEFERKMAIPLRTIRETPESIEKLKREQKNIMSHIVEKKSGQQQFACDVDKLKDSYLNYVITDTCDMTHGSSLDEITTHLSLRLAFLLKYPMTVRGSLTNILNTHLELPEGLQRHKIFNILCGEHAYYELIQSTAIPFNLEFINILFLIEFLNQYDMFFYFFVQDASGAYLKYLKRKYEKTIILEDTTIQGKESLSNVERALAEGNLLVLKNGDQSAFDTLLPIIEWKYRRMMRLMRFFISRKANPTQSPAPAANESETPQSQAKQRVDSDKQSSPQQQAQQQQQQQQQRHPLLEHATIWQDDSILTFNEKTRLQEPILFNGKRITVHKNFRLIFVQQSGSNEANNNNNNNNMTFAHSFFHKLAFIQCGELEDENLWKQTVFDHLLNQLHPKEKSSIITSKIDHLNVKRDSLSKMVTQISMALSTCTTCEDTDFMRLLNENVEAIRNNVMPKESVPIIHLYAGVDLGPDESFASRKRVVSPSESSSFMGSRSYRTIRNLDFGDYIGSNSANRSNEYEDEYANDEIGVDSSSYLNDIIPDQAKRIEDFLVQGPAASKEKDEKKSSDKLDSSSLSKPPQTMLSSQRIVSTSAISPALNNGIGNDTKSKANNVVPTAAKSPENIENAGVAPKKPLFQSKGAKDSQLQQQLQQQQLTSQQGAQNQRQLLKKQQQQEKAEQEQANRRLLVSLASNYHDLDILVCSHMYLLSVLEFLYAIKLNYANLLVALGPVYSFSDISFFMILTQVCQANMKFRVLSSNPPSIEPPELPVILTNETIAATKRFAKRFCETTFQNLQANLADDHRLLFTFYLGMMYARGTNAFVERDWKIFLHSVVPAISTYSSDVLLRMQYLSSSSANTNQIQNPAGTPQMNRSSLSLSRVSMNSASDLLQPGTQQFAITWNKLQSDLSKFFNSQIHSIAQMQCFTPDNQSNLLALINERRELLNSSSPTKKPSNSQLESPKKSINTDQQQQQQMKPIIPLILIQPNIGSEDMNIHPEIHPTNFSLLTPRHFNALQATQSPKTAANSAFLTTEPRDLNPLLLKFKNRNIDPTSSSEEDQLKNNISLQTAAGAAAATTFPQKSGFSQFMTPTQAAAVASTPKQSEQGGAGKLSMLNSQILSVQQQLPSAEQSQNQSRGSIIKLNSEGKFKTTVASISKRFVNLIGSELIEKFLDTFNLISPAAAKQAVTSMISHPEKWISFLQNSLKSHAAAHGSSVAGTNMISAGAAAAADSDQSIDIGYDDANNNDNDENEDEDDTKLKQIMSVFEPHRIDPLRSIPFLPKDFVNSCSPLQMLTIFKHFRPDFLPQIAEHSSQKILKRFINCNGRPQSLENHCSSDWQKRPTILLHEASTSRLIETLEMLHSVVNPDMSIVRLSLGHGNIKFNIDLINQAAGEGRWMLLEEIECLEQTNLKLLIRALDHELEAPTTTPSFRVWITHRVANATSTGITTTQTSNRTGFAFAPFTFASNEAILSVYYETCWKIYYSHPKNIQQAMQKFYYRSIHEYKSYLTDSKNSQASQYSSKAKSVDAPTTDKILPLKRNAIQGNVVQIIRKHNVLQGVTPFPMTILAHEQYLQNASEPNLLATCLPTGLRFLNLFNFFQSIRSPASLVASNNPLPTPTINTQNNNNDLNASNHGNNSVVIADPSADKEDYKAQLTKFTNKMKFSLAFLHCCVGIKRQKANFLMKSYESPLSATPMEFFESDNDFEQEMKAIFNLFHWFPTINPRVFVEKYLRAIYGTSNAYYVSLVVHFVFAVSEQSLKLTVNKNSAYLLYDFASGVFEFVEEGITKTLAEHFPATLDPLEIFFANFNNELAADYTHAKHFMNSITRIERHWHHNNLVRTLYNFEKLKHPQQAAGTGTQGSSPINNNAIRSALIAPTPQTRMGATKRKLSIEVLDQKDSMFEFGAQMISPITQQPQNASPTPPLPNLASPIESESQQQQQNAEVSTKTNELTRMNSDGIAKKNKKVTLLIEDPTAKTASIAAGSSLSPPSLLSGSNALKPDVEASLLASISHEAKSFVKVYYHSLLDAQSSTHELRVLLEHILKAIEFFDFNLKNIPFIQFNQSLQKNDRTLEICASYIQDWAWLEGASIGQSSANASPSHSSQVISNFNGYNNGSNNNQSGTQYPSDLLAFKSLSHQQTLSKIGMNAITSPKSSIFKNNNAYKNSTQLQQPPDFAQSFSFQSSVLGNQQHSRISTFNQANNNNNNNNNTNNSSFNRKSGSNSSFLNQSNSNSPQKAARQGSFRDKMKQTRFESTSTGQQLEQEKKAQKQAQNKEILVQRRETFNRFSDSIPIINFQQQQQQQSQQSPTWKRKIVIKSGNSSPSSNKNNTSSNAINNGDSSPNSQSDQVNEGTENNNGGSNRSFNSDEDSEDIDQVEFIELNSFKSTMLNEVILLFRLISRMKSDINDLLKALATQHNRSRIRADIEQNILPEQWRKLSFKVAQRSFSDFLEILLLKIHHTHAAVIPKGPTLNLPPIVQLDMLLDPYSFLGSYIYNYSQAKNIDITDLKLVLQRIPYVELQKNEPAKEGFYVSGLFLNNGQISKDNLFLMEEETRQFQSELSVFHLKVTKKLNFRQEVFHHYQNYEQVIAIELNDPDTAVLRYDMENEYLFQQIHPIDLYSYAEKNKTDGVNTSNNTDAAAISASNITSVFGGQTNPMNNALSKNNILKKQLQNVVAPASQRRSSNSLANTAKRAQGATKNAAGGIGGRNKDDGKGKDGKNAAGNAAGQASGNIGRLTTKEIDFSEMFQAHKYTFVVHIPFKNPCTSSAYSQFQTKFAFFVNSRKPQDFWNLKGTAITAYKFHL